jgi:16S rRNA (guanine(1405)-N(7))-methyltransferase
MDSRAGALEQLVESVLSSPKYRAVCPELVRRIGAQELGKRRSPKAAVKATKDRLHQVAGAYVARKVNYQAHLRELQRAIQLEGGDELRRVCRQIMSCHASSRERLPILDEFYAVTLGHLPPIRSVLDVGCGLNPLALPWMPLAEGAEYHACDVYEDLVGFVNAFLRLAGVRGGAEVCDVVERCPRQEVEVALVLKTVPCLEQIDRTAGQRLLECLNARQILVSFPVHSLGGAHKGMVANYEARFRELVAGRSWAVTRFEFATELAFLVDKGAGS